MKKRYLIGLGGIALSGAFLYVYQSQFSHEPLLAGGVPDSAVIAHRGLSYEAPESTFAAYNAAAKLKVDYLEGDVQRTQDGVLVIVHDNNLAKKSNIEEVFPKKKKSFIDEFTWEELQQLDIGSWFNQAYPDRARDKFVNLKVIRLEALIDIASKATSRSGRPMGLYLETKLAKRFHQIEDQIVDLLRVKGFLDELTSSYKDSGKQPFARVVFQSFEKESLTRLKEIAPQIPRLALISSEDKIVREPNRWNTYLAEVKTLAHGIGFSSKDAQKYLFEGAAREGFFVHLYTVNDPDLFQSRTLLGTNGFFTDRANLLLCYYTRCVKPLEASAILQKIGY